MTENKPMDEEVGLQFTEMVRSIAEEQHMPISAELVRVLAAIRLYRLVFNEGKKSNSAEFDIRENCSSPSRSSSAELVRAEQRVTKRSADAPLMSAKNVFSEADVEKVARLGFNNSQWRLSLLGKPIFEGQDTFLKRNKEFWEELKRDGKIEKDDYDEVFEAYMTQARKCLSSLSLKSEEQIRADERRKCKQEKLQEIAEALPIHIKEAYEKGRAEGIDDVERELMERHKKAEDCDGCPECMIRYNRETKLLSDVEVFDENGNHKTIPKEQAQKERLKEKCWQCEEIKEAIAVARREVK